VLCDRVAAPGVESPSSFLPLQVLLRPIHLRSTAEESFLFISPRFSWNSFFFITLFSSEFVLLSRCAPVRVRAVFVCVCLSPPSPLPSTPVREQLLQCPCLLPWMQRLLFSLVWINHGASLYTIMELSRIGSGPFIHNTNENMKTSPRQNETRSNKNKENLQK